MPQRLHISGITKTESPRLEPEQQHQHTDMTLAGTELQKPQAESQQKMISLPI